MAASSVAARQVSGLPDLQRVATLNWWGGPYAGTKYGFNAPSGIAFDGTHIWVTDFSGDSLTELNADDGSFVRKVSGPAYGFNAPVRDRLRREPSVGDELCGELRDGGQGEQRLACHGGSDGS